MSTTTYRTKEGETLDEICFRVLDTTSNRVVEEALLLNQHLADYGPELPAGLLITLPDVDAIAVAQNRNAQSLML